MEHRQFTLWKLHAVLMQLGLPCLKLFIPIFLRPLLYGLLGARIGRQTAIGGKLVDPYLTVMEDHSVIGEDSVVTAHIMTHDQFILGRVTIGRKATVGVKAVIMPGVEIGENAIVLPNSVVSLNTRIPANEIWGGNPAKKIKEN
jgi:acetyltransferase-like isoleucine patch superfamily enzyme